MKNTVTQEQVRDNMQDVIVRTLYDFEKPTTYVVVRMKNGFTLRESTTCVDPENYNEEIGAKICLKRIEEKIWFLLGYQLQEELYKEKQREEVINNWYYQHKSINDFYIKGTMESPWDKKAETIFYADKIKVEPYGKTLKELIDNK